jgi:hypothetical protein
MHPEGRFLMHTRFLAPILLIRSRSRTGRVARCSSPPLGATTGSTTSANAPRHWTARSGGGPHIVEPHIDPAVLEEARLKLDELTQRERRSPNTER